MGNSRQKLASPRFWNLKGAYAFLVLVFFGTIATVAETSATHQQCSDNRILVHSGDDHHWFTIEVASTARTRASGLMHRSHLPMSHGMLFVYDRPQSVSFWMRNTLVELDMLFADASGTIVNIHERARPLDETAIFGGEDIQFVLEINGALARRLGIEVGHVMMHRAIDQGIAALPCPE